MKEIIESTGMKLTEFSKYYNIPYNTVRQYYEEKRNPPEWVKNLIKEKIDREKQGEQLKIEL